jgi:transcriptional regulator with GAF, ATPase, and Fis domain
MNTNPLVLGETGTGKELISRAIHGNSLRKARPLVKVNFATLPSPLIESEMFGHERGAFTGAQNRQMGRFREDLFYRLNVFPITAPSLRDRTEDIPLLAKFFVEKGSKRIGKSIELIPESVMKKLQDYPWPGNVRELENVIEQAVINSSEPKLRLADDLAGPAHKEMPTPLKSLQEIETDHIIRVLEETNWRIDGPKGAALVLDMNPSTLCSRMQKLEIKKP